MLVVNFDELMCLIVPILKKKKRKIIFFYIPIAFIAIVNASVIR